MNPIIKFVSQIIPMKIKGKKVSKVNLSRLPAPISAPMALLNRVIHRHIAPASKATGRVLLGSALAIVIGLILGFELIKISF